jgi:hypothetical protein
VSHSSRRRETWLYFVGALLLLYAVLGNYVALPGYLRFLERAGRSEAGNTFDGAVAFGAAKTILWMFSFQIGFALVWLAAWSWPSLPAPGRWFYLTFGGAVLVVIFRVLTLPPVGATGRLSRTLFLSSLAFFAAATWEVCGLGSTGRMLHPDQAARPLAHDLLVTQSSKLMFELLFAWGLLLVSAVVSRKESPA